MTAIIDIKNIEQLYSINYLQLHLDRLCKNIRSYIAIRDGKKNYEVVFSQNAEERWRGDLTKYQTKIDSDVNWVNASLCSLDLGKIKISY